jgi:hypothetical protein
MDGLELSCAAVLNMAPAHPLEPLEGNIVRKLKTAQPQTDISAPGERPVRRGPGRPPIHAEEWTKATVVLFTRQIAFLDRLADRIRAANGAAVSRAQLIRALIDAIGESDVDLTAVRSEADIKQTVLSRLA